MKKQLYLFGLLLFPFFIQAQNVGIGTTTPQARLQINHRSSTTVGLKLLDSFPNYAGSIKFSTINNPVGMNISSFYESSFNNGHYLDISSDTAFIATFRGNGNVGLGVESPLYRLDVNGDINTNGLLRINGNTGTAGQILTSNGSSADPTWVTPGLTHYVGELFGGGIIVAVWKIAGVEHGLIASLTNLSTGANWSNVTSPAVGTNAYDGQANTTAIIAQPGHINSAAKLCNDFSSGGFTDWYLPAAWELFQCFTAAHIVNTVLGPANGFGFTSSSYWSSTEDDQTYAYIRGYYTLAPSSPKGANNDARAVRKF
jgi:hypothetical protein